jgi:hypothetical protein
MTIDRATKRTHPYSSFEGTHIWKTVDLAVNDLIENGDIIEQTSHDYVVGYLCKFLAEKAGS